MKKIRVLIVDDSLLIRQMFNKILSDQDDIEVVGLAEDAFDAREKIKELNPDVITLDIEMPGMDGISFLKKLMSLRPIPVVMASSLTQKGAAATLKALEIGAVDYVSKTSSQDFNVEEMAHELVAKVRAASRVKTQNITESKVMPESMELSKKYKFKDNLVFFIGSSTGGVEALREVLTKLPANFPPILVTQHMPPKFTTSFAERLDKICKMSVCEASNGMVVSAGNIYIAAGGKQFKVIKRGLDYACVVEHGEKVSGHLPSVDVLFSSAAKVVGNDAIGVILTGMGSDGAKGMLEMKNAGCYNIGQNEDSCIVYGMPKAAYMAGAVDKQVSLHKISSEMINLAKVE